MLKRAFVRSLEVIGEATKKVPEEGEPKGPGALYSMKARRARMPKTLEAGIRRHVITRSEGMEPVTFCDQFVHEPHTGPKITSLQASVIIIGSTPGPII